MHNMQSWAEGGSGVAIGECIFMVDSTDPLITLDNMTFLKSGSLLQDEKANYPEAYAGFEYPRRERPYNWAFNDTGDSNYGVVFGNGVYLRWMPGTPYKLLSSVDGEVWAEVAVPNLVYLWDITFAGGMFVMSCSTVANGGNDTSVMSSTDGLNWTLRTIPAGFYSKLSHTGSNFILMRDSGYSANAPFNFVTSPDGITWTGRSGTAITASPYSISGNNGYAVVSVLDAPSLHYVSSAPHTAWSSIGIGTQIGNYASIGGMVVAFGKYFVIASDGKILSSANLATWALEKDIAIYMAGIQLINGELVAFGSQVWTTTDGVNWVLRKGNDSHTFRGMTYGATNGYVGCGSGFIAQPTRRLVGVSARTEVDGLILYMRVK